jgi:hypothetical protein
LSIYPTRVARERPDRPGRNTTVTGRPSASRMANPSRGAVGSQALSPPRNRSSLGRETIDSSARRPHVTWARRPAAACRSEFGHRHATPPVALRPAPPTRYGLACLRRVDLMPLSLLFHASKKCSKRVTSGPHLTVE